MRKYVVIQAGHNDLDLLGGPINKRIVGHIVMLHNEQWYDQLREGSTEEQRMVTFIGGVFDVKAMSAETAISRAKRKIRRINQLGKNKKNRMRRYEGWVDAPYITIEEWYAGAPEVRPNMVEKAPQTDTDDKRHKVYNRTQEKEELQRDGILPWEP